MKDEVPEAVGVPLIWPALLRDNPAGSEPEIIDQLYGVVPPLATRNAEYDVLTCPLGTDVVVIDRAEAPTVIPSPLFPLLLLASITCTVKDQLPDDVAVPEIVPVEAVRFSPDGSDPLEMLQV